jgi:2',3'-cyclic-nucleotide 2'-phosphodiesterase (5'-nucleotidase family)
MRHDVKQFWGTILQSVRDTTESLRNEYTRLRAIGVIVFQGHMGFDRENLITTESSGKRIDAIDIS